jgi:hypothetical protein
MLASLKARSSWTRHGARLRHDSEKGLSLISLLVVVLLLGIVSAIAVATLNSGQTTGAKRPQGVGDGSATPSSDISLASRAACEASAKAIETAALAYYYTHNETWPVDIATLADPTARYLRNVPDAKWGLVYDNTNGTVDATPCGK